VFTYLTGNLNTTPHLGQGFRVRCKDQRRDWSTTLFQIMESKTQELLENLKQITKPKKPQPRYDVVSNQYGEDEKGRPIYIDRLYGSLTGKMQLVNKNMSIYKGKIHKRSIMIKGKEGKFRSHAYETADGRWFDRAGMPTNSPKNIVKEEPAETTIEVQKTELTADEKMQIEKDFLSRLK
jgi:hypothetical protein